jgi:hypothetical protein
VAFVASVVVDQAQVRTGPGEQHPLLTTIEGPISVRVIGINSQKTWLFILLPDNRQGWIPVASVKVEFDLDLLPVVKDTPLPPTPYGSSMLVPPQLLGVTPASPSSPGRTALSVIAVSALALLVLGASAVHSRHERARRPTFQRLLQILTSLF